MKKIVCIRDYGILTVMEIVRNENLKVEQTGQAYGLIMGCERNGGSNEDP